MDDPDAQDAFTVMEYDKERNMFVAQPKGLHVVKTVADCGCGGMCTDHKLPDGHHLCMSYTQQPDGSQPKRCMNYVGTNVSFCEDHKVRVPRAAADRMCAYADCIVYTPMEYRYCVKHSNIVLSESLDTGYSEAEDAEIDDGLCRRISSTPLKYRHYRKTYNMDTIHYKMEIVKGKRDDRIMFHLILHEVDHDYPLNPERTRPDYAMCCTKCHGYVWKHCTITPQDMKRAAKQAGIHIKMQHYITDKACGGQIQEMSVGAS